MTLTDDLSICTKAGSLPDRFTSVWELVESSSDPEVRARRSA